MPVPWIHGYADGASTICDCDIQISILIEIADNDLGRLTTNRA
jgi:hypothetical protein